jgi:hypothetical protein
MRSVLVRQSVRFSGFLKTKAEGKESKIRRLCDCPVLSLQGTGGDVYRKPSLGGKADKACTAPKGPEKKAIGCPSWQQIAHKETDEIRKPIGRLNNNLGQSLPNTPPPSRGREGRGCAPLARKQRHFLVVPAYLGSEMPCRPKQAFAFRVV